MASYADGVTIKVNGTPVSISDAQRQSNHAIVYYTIPTVLSTDTVTWEYAKSSGEIRAEAGGTPLENVSARTVTNNVTPAGPVLLLDLEADTLVLSDGDPVSTWADQSGNHNDFTQTGDARPTYRSGSGIPYVEFDGIDDWLLGPNFANNLTSFAVFVVFDASVSSAGTDIICKNNNPGDGAGWIVGGGQAFCIILQEDGGSNWDEKIEIPTISTRHVHAALVNGGWTLSDISIYRDGILSKTSDNGPDSIASITTTEPVRIGTDGSAGDFWDSPIYAIRIYAPCPSLSDVATISSALMTRYGISAGTAPTFVSGETVLPDPDADKIIVTFSDDIASRGGGLELGVTVKVNGTENVVLSGSRDPVNFNKIIYALTTLLVSGDIITWEYSATSGLTYGEATGLALADVTAQSITNNIS